MEPIKKLDFSQFHGLFHWIASPDCWRSYGGPTRHLQLWWQYQRPGWDKDVDWDHPVELEKDEK